MPSSESRPKTSNVERQITESLAKLIGAHKYDMWFGHTRFRMEGKRLAIATDSQFVANWIDTHFAKDLRGVASEAIGKDVQIDVHVAPEMFGRRDDEAEAPTPAGRTKTRRPRAAAKQEAVRRLPPLRRLEDFIVGRANQLAYAAATRIVEEQDPKLISPLFVHGDCGVGKTHLLQGICQRFREAHGKTANVRYVTGEQFTNEYITAIRTNALDEFRLRMRKLDLLAIDDVHFLANKVRTQSEFLHTLDALDMTGARVVLGCDAHPRHLKRFSQALVSRFLSGMVVQVERPDRDTRKTLIRTLAATRGLPVNEAAIEAIAARYVSSVRELEGAVTKLAALRTLMKPTESSGEVGMVLTEQLFSDHGLQPATPVRIGTVIECVCERLGINQGDLMGSSRHRRVVLGRALVAYLARELTTQSYPEIAQALGRSYHSTVHTAAQRLTRQLGQDERVDLGGPESTLDLKELVDELRHSILRATSNR